MIVVWESLQENLEDSPSSILKYNPQGLFLEISIEITYKDGFVYVNFATCN